MMLMSSEGLVGWEGHPKKGSRGKKRMLVEQDPLAFACLGPCAQSGSLARKGSRRA
jgi:hypothetical protein